MPAVTTATGARAYRRVTVENPGPPIPDAQGSYRETWTASPLPWYVAIDPAAVDSERLASGVVTVQPIYTVVGPYRPDVSTSSRLIVDDGGVLSISGVESPGRRNVELVLRCVEIKDPEGSV